MIKGCSRKVIVLKNPGSDLFEEAYFIVSPKQTERKHGDLLLEANRIIASKTVPNGAGTARHAGIMPWLVGFILGAAAAFPVAYFVF